MSAVAGGRAAAAALAVLLAGCGSKAGAVDAGMKVPDFSACLKTDAGVYMDGIVVTSASQAFTAKLLSVSTVTPTLTTVAVPTIGLSVFQISFLDAEGVAPVGLKVTAEKPYMPLHGHGATTYPTVVDSGGGAFTISQINFFMGGYWEVTLDLKPAPVVVDAAGGDAGTDGGGAVVDGAVSDGAVSDGAVADATGGIDAGDDAPAPVANAGSGDPHVVPPTSDKIVFPICIPN